MAPIIITDPISFSLTSRKLSDPNHARSCLPSPPSKSPYTTQIGPDARLEDGCGTHAHASTVVIPPTQAVGVPVRL
jgi:hypothetical protein